MTDCWAFSNLEMVLIKATVNILMQCAFGGHMLLFLMHKFLEVELLGDRVYVQEWGILRKV